MKAYKQINLQFEYRMVYSYAALLCFISFFILLSPILAQEESDPNQPEVRIDIKKEYDSLGNIAFYDSVYTWSWNGHDFPTEKLDSLFENLNNGFQNIDFSNRLHFRDFPFDSTNLSYFNFEDLQQYVDKNFHFEDFLSDEKYLNDFRFKNEEFMDRFRKYQEEHRLLIEKYFLSPNNLEDKEIEPQQNSFFPENIKSNQSNLGKI